MNPDQWQQIGQLYHVASELEPDERAAFLDGACGGGDELRREVESLLRAHQQADGFIAGKVADAVAEMIAQQPNPSLVGHSISHYQVLSLLGAGGMGEVYLAQDTSLGRKVALKLLPATFTRDQERVRRFEREARAVSALNHPNILTIYEVGIAGETHFIATEFIDGQTLRERLRDGRLELSEALDLAIQTASALSAAHEAGIVHRDIKPENVMVRRDGLVKVLDFSLAKLTETKSLPVDSQASAMTKLSTDAGVVIGTVSYMSPEQARGLKVDTRTDIFSLGVMLYEMVVGRAPFAGATTGDVIASILRDSPPPLAECAPDALPEMERILSRALRKDREERYQAVSEFLADLKRLKRQLELKDGLKNGLARASGPASESEVSVSGEATLTDVPLEQAESAIAVEANSGADPVANQRPRAFLVAMAALAVMIFFYAFTCALALRYGSTDKFGYRTRLVAGQQTIREVHLGSPAAGRLEVGDRIVALNDDARFSRVEPFVLLQTLPEGQSYTLRVRRVTNGQPAELEFTLTCTSYPTTSLARWRLIWTHLLRALVCLAVAFFIIWLKPGERFSLVAFCAFLTISVLEVRVVLDPLWEQLIGAPRALTLIFWAMTGGHLFVPFAYQTAYMFPPEAFRKGRFWTALQWLLYAGLVVGASHGFVYRLIGELPQQLDLLYNHTMRIDAIKTFAELYYPAGLVAISAVLIRNFLYTTDPQQRRRIKWVITGTLIATVALTAMEMAKLGLEASGRYAATSSAQFRLLSWAANALALVFPLSWAYAILNRRIYDVRFVIRRGVQYLLAKNALRLLLALPLIGLAGAVYANRDRTLANLLFHNSLWFYVSLLAAVAISLAYRYNLSKWLDRRFFREAYRQDKLLRQLTEEIRQLDSLAEMARRVSQMVDAALHPERLYLFYREEGRRDLSLSYSSGGLSRDLRIPAEFELLRFLEYQGCAQTFPFPAKTRLPPQEKKWLASLGASLIVPMSGTDGRLKGLLVLGPKRSETPYTSSDRQLLEMLAEQFALVYENSHSRF